MSKTAKKLPVVDDEVPGPGPIPFDRVHGLATSSIELEVREYLATAALIKAFEAEQESRRLVVLRLLKNAGVKSVTVGPAIASVTAGRETVRLDRKKLLTLVGPDVVEKATVRTTGEPSVRITPVKDEGGEE